MNALTSVVVTEQVPINTNISLSEFSQSLKGFSFVSGIVVFVRGSLRFVRGEIHHVQIVLPGVN